LPHPLDALKARRLADIVASLRKKASFRSILRESARENVIRDTGFESYTTAGWFQESRRSSPNIESRLAVA